MPKLHIAQLKLLHPLQPMFQLRQQLAPFPDTVPLLRFPFLLLRLQDQLRCVLGAGAFGFDAELVGREGGFEGFVGVVEGQLGLGEVVVGFHVVAVEVDAVEAVVDAGVP